MVEVIASIFLGLGLSASVGFRIFLPLLALSLAHYFGIVSLNESWTWVSSPTAIIVFGVATVLETLAYFIPWFDNLLDTIALPTATLAGTAVMASTIVELDPLWQWALAIIAGGGTAGLIKAVNTKTRLASTATTGGLGNPVVSATETIFSAGLSVLSIFLWPLAGLAIILLLIGLIVFYRKLRRYRRKKHGATEHTAFNP